MQTTGANIEPIEDNLIFELIDTDTIEANKVHL